MSDEANSLLDGKWVELREYERLREGDEYQDWWTGEWIKTTQIGMAVGVPLRTTRPYRRFVKRKR
jgi:hypothetical protein